MKLPNFAYTWIGKFIGKKIGLKEGSVDSKKWFQSKGVWTGIVTAIVGAYLSLQPQFGWPAIPEWVFTILGAIGVYSRVVATKEIK